jgi:hypothetical protein
VRKPPSIAHLPHVHRAVYFKTPAEHNRALLEGAIRCLSLFSERNPDHFPMTLNEALSHVRDLIEELPKETKK